MIFIREKIVSWAEFIHIKLFGHEKSDVMRDFLKNLSWSFFGGIIAAAIMFLVNVMAGRFLGPIEFGKYNYIYSFAASLTFFFLLGNNQSGIRYISDEKYKERKNNILNALFFLTLVQSLALFFIAFIFGGMLSKKFGISITTVYFVFFMGFVFSFKELFDSFLRSFGYFKKQSFLKIGDAFLVLSFFTFSLLFFKGKLEYLHYAWAMMIGASFSIMIPLYFFKGRFGKFDKSDLSIIFHYNKFLIIAGISGLILGLEKILIGKFMGMESLGNYSAYYASSQMIVSNFSILFMNIFWPTVIKNKANIEIVVNKLSRLFFKYFPIWIALNFASISFFIFLYGKQYEMTVMLILLFAIATILNVFYSVFMSIMNIDKISKAIIINMAVYVIMISTIIIFRNIPAYLIAQMVIYSIGIIYVRNKLKSDTTIKI